MAPLAMARSQQPDGSFRPRARGGAATARGLRHPFTSMADTPQVVQGTWAKARRG